MGVIYVKTGAEMARENRLFELRKSGVTASILFRLAGVNVLKSKEVVKEHSFTGTLMSSIQSLAFSKKLVQVIASAPHASAIETGIPPIQRGYVSFDESPMLRRWVEDKLMKIDPAKARYFLSIGKARIGMRGFPYGYPSGLRFMELGYLFAVDMSGVIVAEEIRKLGPTNVMMGLTAPPYANFVMKAKTPRISGSIGT